MTILLALLGFGPTDTQTKWPPALAWLFLLAASYYAAEVIEWLAWLVPFTSVYFRTVGVLAAAVLTQAILRTIFFRDGLSWSGWLRERSK